MSPPSATCPIVEILIKPNELIVVNKHVEFVGGVVFSNSRYGILVGPHPEGMVSNVQISDVPRYQNKNQNREEWIKESFT